MVVLAFTLWNTLHLHLPVPPSATDIGPSLAAGEWALFQRDPQRTGFAPGEGALPQGALLWRREQSSRIISPPILSDGILFVSLGEGRILTLLSTTGEVVWERALPSPVDLPVAVAGGYVYAVQRNGGIVAMHKGNGELLWDFQAPDSILAAPLVSGGVVYLSTREPRLYAIDAVTGQVRWTYKLTAFSLSPPSLFDTVLALGTEDGNLHLVDARKGTPRRLYPTGSPLRGSPVLADGRVYVAGNSRYVWALDLYTQELPLEKALHACDDLTGFIVAVALVRPGRSLEGVDAAAVRRKMKDKAFARAVDREEMVLAAEEFGVPFDQHIAHVVDAMRGIAPDLGLGGGPPAES
jgi:hypothetical protein